jgi:uncharacterized protein YbjT (DUF2867 family)
MSRPTTLVAGANGTLGRAVVAELARRGHRVRALSRRDVSLPGATEVVRGDLDDAASLAQACRGVDAVVSAAGASLSLAPRPRSATFEAVDRDGTLRLIAAAQAARVRRFAYVSVFHTPAQADTTYVRAHVEAERVLEASGLDAVVVRPTGFFDALRPLLTMARLGAAPRIGSGAARSNPIAPEDLASVVADALHAGTPRVDAGGPDVLSRAEMFEVAFRAIGRRPRFVPVSPVIVEANARLVRPLDPRLSDLLRFFSRVSTTDCVAPARGVRHLEDYFTRLAAVPE